MTSFKGNFISDVKFHHMPHLLSIDFILICHGRRKTGRFKQFIILVQSSKERKEIKSWEWKFPLSGSSYITKQEMGNNVITIIKFTFFAHLSTTMQ